MLARVWNKLRWDVTLVVVSILIGLAFAGYMVWTTAERELSPREAVLFQIIILGVSLVGGLIGSYKFGQSAATNKQYARSALRSVLVLFGGLQRLRDAVEQVAIADQAGDRLQLLLLQIDSQMDLANSAINDWRDLIPEEFEDVGGNLERPEYM